MNRYLCPGSTDEIWLTKEYIEIVGKAMCPTCGAEMEMID
jgi:uncharacterized protein (UPF0212 family)